MAFACVKIACVAWWCKTGCTAIIFTPFDTSKTQYDIISKVTLVETIGICIISDSTVQYAALVLN